MITSSRRVLFLLGILAAQAQAQDCANPLPIDFEVSGNSSGDLCTATNSLPGYGVTPSPQNEIVYSFVDNGFPTNFAIQQGPEGTWGGQSVAMFLMPSPCSSSTDPIGLGFPGTPMQVGGLTVGQTYYVIITADPGSPPGTCGTYQLEPFRIPVELQTFTID